MFVQNNRVSMRFSMCWLTFFSYATKLPHELRKNSCYLGVHILLIMFEVTNMLVINCGQDLQNYRRNVKKATLPKTDFLLRITISTLHQLMFFFHVI